MDHEAGRGTSSATGPFDTWSARDPAARRLGGAPGTTCAHVCAAPRPPGAGVASRPRPRGCERPRGDGADLERVAARLGGRLTPTPVTCRRRGSLSVACHRGAPIPEGTRRQSRADVTPAHRSPDSGSAPQGPLCHGFWSERACQDMDEAGGFSRQRGRGRGSAALGPVARSPRPRGQKVPALRRSGRRPAPHGHARPACLVPTWFAHTARGASSRDAHTSKAHTDRTEIRPCSGNYTDPNLPLVCFAIFTRDSLFSY